MRCQNCGANLDNGVLFCRECGTRVVRSKRFCRECGIELPPEVKFCPNCGVAIDLNIQNPDNMDQKSSFTPPSKTEPYCYHETGNQRSASDVIPPSQDSISNHDHHTSKKQGKFHFRWLYALALLAIIILCIGAISQMNSKSISAPAAANSVNSSDLSTTQTNYKIKVGSQYSFMSDEWNVYIATAVSDSIISIEHWDKTLKSTKSMSFSDDIGAFKINDSENGFSWVDSEHTAFNLIFQDRNNSKTKKLESHVFTIDINDSDTFKGSDYDESIASYIYTSDDWHTYRAVPLTANLIKIECWSRTSKLDDLCFGWDWCVINTKENDIEFEWTDENRTSFTVVSQDTQNKSHWSTPALVLFKLEKSDYTYHTVVEYLDANNPLTESKPEKNGYNEQTNITEHFGNYSFSFPTYWEGKSCDSTKFQAYAETSGKSAMFQAFLQPTNYANMSYEVFASIQDEFMNSFAKSFEEFDIQKSETFDNGSVKGFFYTCKFAISGFQGNDGWFLLALDHETNQYLMIGLMETNNTQYTYYGDFIQILDSLEFST